MCLEATDGDERRTNFPFECGHVTCSVCDAQLRRRDDNRCPTCRAPRVGFTAEQAEPQAADNLATYFSQSFNFSAPQSSATIFFPSQPPTSFDSVGSHVPAALISALEQDDSAALQEIQQGLPTELIEALVNVPTNLREWRNVQARVRRASHTAAASRSFVSTTQARARALARERARRREREHERVQS